MPCFRIGEETSVAFRSAKVSFFRGAKGDNAAGTAHQRRASPPAERVPFFGSPQFVAALDETVELGSPKV
jgi:hypothetical protein